MASQIETYCNKNMIDSSSAKRILLVFEEVSQLLVSAMKQPRIRAVLEYSEKDRSAVWTISYAGEKKDIMKDQDDLGLMVLKGMCEKIDHSWNEEEDLPNELDLKVRLN